METVLWIIVIGFFLYMMVFRGGCCGGHKHKKSEHNANSNNGEQDAVNAEKKCH